MDHELTIVTWNVNALSEKRSKKHKGYKGSVSRKMVVKLTRQNKTRFEKA